MEIKVGIVQGGREIVLESDEKRTRFKGILRKTAPMSSISV